MSASVYQKIIENYITAYNKFDVPAMIADMHESITFENISNGSPNLRTQGIVEFKNQAEQAKGYFTEREQKIINSTIDTNLVRVDIEYRGILAIDLPNGMKAGDELRLTGKSIFKFKDNKIIELQDIS